MLLSILEAAPEFDASQLFPKIVWDLPDGLEFLQKEPDDLLKAWESEVPPPPEPEPSFDVKQEWYF